MPGLTWEHTENIALALHDKFPDLDPTHIRYTDLHQWITELADFKDDPKARQRFEDGVNRMSLKLGEKPGNMSRAEPVLDTVARN